LLNSGCFLWGEGNMARDEFLSYDDILSIYDRNRDVINRIKDGLISSDFTPIGRYPRANFNVDEYKAIILMYDFSKHQLILTDGDISDEQINSRLQSIRSVHDDAIEYFLDVGKENNPSILYREVTGYTIIEFAFRSNYRNSDPRAGIIYTTNPKELWGEVHIEDNWYAYKYEMD
jgi:hypothetical protein